MTLFDCRDMLTQRRKAVRALPLEGTMLSGSANVFIGMIDAYLADGNRFLAAGDSMNAHASFWYALGWLDAGACLGLLALNEPVQRPDFTGIFRSVTERARVEEKTTRYRSLLCQALEGVEPAPDEGSSLFPAARKFLKIAESCCDRGRVLEDEGDLEAALGAYSYGFAWLDAGARFGFFRIRRDRELFTL